MRIRPDGFTGALMAIEGISNARAVLHGPGGCRLCHMILSRKTFPRMESGGTTEYNIPYFFGQPRLPCTYLEETDYINGAYDIVVDALPFIESKKDGMITIINSPGAALIGDNHGKAINEVGIADKAFAIEESLVSVPLCEGYDHTLRSVLEWLSPKKIPTVPNTVNVIGMSILDKDWKNGVREITRSLQLLGLDIISFPGAGCSTYDLERSVGASLNVVVCPEFGIEVAKFYEEEYGIPYVISPSGAPIGFDSTIEWIRTVADRTGKDPSEAIGRIERYKDCVFHSLMGSRFKTIKMRGSSFSIYGEASIVYPLTKWLYHYLSMIPLSVVVDQGSYSPMIEPLKDFLISIEAGDAFQNENDDWSDFVFADGDTAVLLEKSGRCGKGIDIGLPTSEYLSLIPRPIVAAKGSLYILDEIMKDF